MNVEELIKYLSDLHSPKSDVIMNDSTRGISSDIEDIDTDENIVTLNGFSKK